jgi:non-heme chloroperoxidase
MNHRIEVEKSVRVYVVEWGKGKPIVFISGWPFDSRSYEYQFNQLSQQGFRCIGIDMRGFGKSDKPWEEYNYDFFADDIHKVLQALKIKDALLVGHSMGGAISLHYAAKYPKMHIAKLMLCGAAAPSFTQKEDYPYGMTEQQVNDLLKLCESDRAKMLTNFGKIFFHKEISPELAQWFWMTGMDASAYATAACIELLRDADLRSDLAKVTIPTLIAHGIHDKICPYEFAKILNKGIAHSQLITFEESGHGLFYDEREKFNKTVMDFAR